jgi:hypothetical protein
MKHTKQQIMREIQQKQRMRKRIIVYGGLSLASIAIITVIVLLVSKSPGGPIGDEVGNLSRDHISSNVVPGPYTTDPPAGGAHYSSDFPAKFYQEADLVSLPKNPEGYLVHSLEHGYVIFWYNCQIPNTDCSALKQTIQKVMDETGSTKLIAFPWTSMDTSLAITSWGRILKFLKPDPVQMKQFVERNRGQAPEPDAP